MPYQNRVTPFGELEAHPARGLFLGNRGILHDGQGVLGRARWRHKNWIICSLTFGNRRLKVMGRGCYTPLFFCDEAVALAAGHRPCWTCRRDQYKQYMAAWRAGHGLPEDAPLRAPDVDEVLHHARVNRRGEQVRSHARLNSLPDGSFICLTDDPGAAWLLWQGQIHRWSHEGYNEHRPAVGTMQVEVITPEPTVRVLAAGYTPVVHPSAHMSA